MDDAISVFPRDITARYDTMSERRRAEIEAKRAKLAELKKAKELRKQQELERRAQGSPVSCVSTLTVKC